MEYMDGHPTVVFKPVYNCFKFKSSEAMKGLNEEKSTSLKDSNLFISNLKRQDSDVVPNPHPDDGRNIHVVTNASIASGFMAWKESMDENDKEGSKERKVAMDCDLPELVAFLQESSNYQFFKDICIDKEVPCQDKCLVENSELDRNNISCILDSDPDSSNESIGETLDSESSVSTEHDCEKEVSKRCGSENLEMEDKKYFEARDDLSVDHSTKMTISETLLVQARQGQGKAVLENSMVLSKTWAIDDNSLTSSVSHHFDTSRFTTDGREEVPQSAECHPPEIGTMFGPELSEDGMSDSVTGSSQRHQRYHGESVSSAYSEPPSGSLALAIQSFGSISLRSNSSTTSSQSFAFPILSSEWNGSPARMVKADQRELQKNSARMAKADQRELQKNHHRGMRFLCCKF